MMVEFRVATVSSELLRVGIIGKVSARAKRRENAYDQDLRNPERGAGSALRAPGPRKPRKSALRAAPAGPARAKTKRVHAGRALATRGSARGLRALAPP